jgi:PAS domain S-box-containing protein
MELTKYNIFDDINDDLLEVVSKNTIITITDALGRLEYANQNYCNIIECDANKLIGETHELLKSHLHANKIYKELWQTIRAGNKWQGVINDISANGKLFWLETTIIPVKNVEDNRIKYVAIYKDVTKYKLENTQLLESKVAYSKYMAIYQSLDVGIIVITDNVGNIIEWNKGAELAFGYTKVEILGHPLSVIMAIKYRKGNIKELLVAIDKIKESQNSDKIELYCIRQDGDEFPVEFTLNKLSLDNSIFYCANMLDITKRKDLENKLTLRTKVLKLFLRRTKRDKAPSSFLENNINFLNNNDVEHEESECAETNSECIDKSLKSTSILSSSKSKLKEYEFGNEDFNLDEFSK